MPTAAGRTTAEDYEAADELLRGDLELYCANLVKIKTKSGDLTPLIWNEAQRYLHKRIERQIETDGWVRVLILKARQLGISTYTAARFYHKTSLWMGQSTHILTHLDDATQQLFGMAKRIHENMPVDYRPRDTSNNANQLVFGRLDSGYSVGTAYASSGKGRSKTFQKFHGSEVAFWRDAGEHFGAAMQAVPKAPRTEIILESTANGIGGTFYDQWKLAEKGKSDFITVFLPWYWEPAYRQTPKPGWEPSPEEHEYGEIFSLDVEQLCWMHFKNIELEGEPGKIGWRFRQEYPATATEAFQTSGDESFIKPELVLKARQRTMPEQTHAARVLGVDLARGGDDDTRFIDRKGAIAGEVINETMDTDDPMEIVGRLARILTHHPDIQMAFVDVTDGGGGVVARLNELGFGARVRGVNFGSKPQNEQHYLNKRAEMWGEMRDWFRDPAGSSIPDDDVLHSHICAPAMGPGAGKYDSRNRLVLESKEKIKQRLKFSPDGGDALGLTFSEPVALPIQQTASWRDQMGEDHYELNNDFWTS